MANARVEPHQLAAREALPRVRVAGRDGGPRAILERTQKARVDGERALEAPARLVERTDGRKIEPHAVPQVGIGGRSFVRRSSARAAPSIAAANGAGESANDNFCGFDSGWGSMAASLSTSLACRLSKSTTS